MNLFILDFLKTYLWFVYWCDHPVALSWETIQKTTMLVWDAKDPNRIKGWGPE